MRATDRARAEAVLAGRETGDDELSSALTTLGVIGWREGRLVDAVGLLRAAVNRLGVATTVDGHQSYPKLALAALFAMIGEFALADGLVGEPGRDRSIRRRGLERGAGVVRRFRGLRGGSPSRRAAGP